MIVLLRVACFLIAFLLLESEFSLSFPMNAAINKKKNSMISTNTNCRWSKEDDTNNDDFLNGDECLNGSKDPLMGRLEELKQQESLLSAQLAAVRREKLRALRSRPLTIGLIGFGRFGQFIAKVFAQKHGHKVIVTSRSDYSHIAQEMGIQYIPYEDPSAFFGRGSLDVILFCVSILSFQETVDYFLPFLKQDLVGRPKGPLVVDVLSVKEHPRKILLQQMPPQVDLLLTHPMFGPDSGKNGWHGLTFVYEKTRINGVLLDYLHNPPNNPVGADWASFNVTDNNNFMDTTGIIHSVHEHSEAHVEAVDRMERLLSIWEEEGCHMVQMSCREHDAHAANSQFITHLMGRILGQQGLTPTPIDTTGFKNVLKLVESTTADSFDLFYGLFKFNQHSQNTIVNLQNAMDDVVTRLQNKKNQEEEEELQCVLPQPPEKFGSSATASYLDGLGMKQ